MTALCLTASPLHSRANPRLRDDQFDIAVFEQIFATLHRLSIQRHIRTARLEDPEQPDEPL
jgi:hypothetical protein